MSRDTVCAHDRDMAVSVLNPMPAFLPQLNVSLGRDLARTAPNGVSRSDREGDERAAAVYPTGEPEAVRGDEAQSCIFARLSACQGAGSVEVHVNCQTHPFLRRFRPCRK